MIVSIIGIQKEALKIQKKNKNYLLKRTPKHNQALILILKNERKYIFYYKSFNFTIHLK